MISTLMYTQIFYYIITWHIYITYLVLSSLLLIAATYYDRVIIICFFLFILLFWSVNDTIMIFLDTTPAYFIDISALLVRLHSIYALTLTKILAYTLIFI